jgi:hypothetical protein
VVDGGTAHRGTVIARLKKADAERMLAGYDNDPIAALTTALRLVLGMPDASWLELLAAAPIDAARRELLLVADQTALDQLAAELNERRTLDPVR